MDDFEQRKHQEEARKALSQAETMLQEAGWVPIENAPAAKRTDEKD
jgi:hypothetical protein